MIALAVVVMIMMMFSGVIIDLAAVSGVLRWLKLVSGVRYACNVLMINEFRNLSLCLANNTNICPRSGNDVLEEKSIDHASSWDTCKYSFGSGRSGSALLLPCLHPTVVHQKSQITCFSHCYDLIKRLGFCYSRKYTFVISPPPLCIRTLPYT